MESGAVPDGASIDVFTDLEKKGSDSESPETQRWNGRKNGGSKESGHSIRFSVNKIASHFKKSPHRRSASPLNWFPRKKSDSFLKRKIRRLQEVGGMNSTLDETLGNANPHYTRMTREKIAAGEAARKAMEARKAAMVEASWCRILRAARIQSKEAEAELEKAEKYAVEAFEAARALGVMMYDRPDCPRRPCEIESSSAVGGASTHKVTAAFETAFEVDKEVAAAVKRAFIQLANCPSSSEKEEFRDLLRKISQNPDSETDWEITGISSESDHIADFSGDDAAVNEHDIEMKQRKWKSIQPLAVDCNMNMELVSTMLGRLKGLQEDELASLAIIVATCGLSAALLEVESSKDHQWEPVTSCHLGSASMSSLGTSTRRNSGVTRFMDGHMKGKEAAIELPSLDKFLVKHVSRLEREVQEARNSKKSNPISVFRGTSGASKEQSVESHLVHLDRTSKSSESTSDLGSILVKHVSKLEREIQKAKNFQKNNSILGNGKSIQPSESSSTESPPRAVQNRGGILVDHSSQIEEKVEGVTSENEKETKKSKDPRGPTENLQHRNLDLHETVPSFPSDARRDKENIERNILAKSSSTADMSKKRTESMNQLPVKHMSRIERAKLESLKAFSSLDGRNETNEPEGLDKILVKPVHRLEREKMQSSSTKHAELLNESPIKHISRLERARLEVLESFSSLLDGRSETNEPAGLDQILVKPVCRLEREKMQLQQQGAREEMVRVVKRDQQSENMESLGDILVKHQPGLDKAKLAAARQSEDHIKHVDARREARARELQEAWGGLSLGNSIRPSVSRLERDKADWRRAEEEERRQARVL